MDKIKLKLKKYKKNDMGYLPNPQSVGYKIKIIS